jgi:hypothetical protein
MLDVMLVRGRHCDVSASNSKLPATFCAITDHGTFHLNLLAHIDFPARTLAEIAALRKTCSKRENERTTRLKNIADQIARNAGEQRNCYQTLRRHWVAV